MTKPTTHDLRAAITHEDHAGLRELLRNEPTLADRSFDELRGLHLAVLHADAEAVRILLDAGAELHPGVYPCRDATTPRQLAEMRGLTAIVTLFDQAARDRQAELSCPNVTVTPELDAVVEAIGRRDATAAIALLEAQPDLIRACDAEGRTPLHRAAGQHLDELVTWLCDRHAPMRQPDIRGRQPIDHAVTAVPWRHPGSVEPARRIAALLRSRGAALTWWAAVTVGTIDELARFWAQDPDTPATLPFVFHQGGLLTHAVKFDRADVIDWLLAHGLDPNEPQTLHFEDEPEHTAGAPLWHAVAMHRPHLVDRLLAAGADPNATVYASGDSLYQAYSQHDDAMKARLLAAGGIPSLATVGLHGDLDLARAAMEDPSLVRQDFPDWTWWEELLWGAACGGHPDVVRLCLAHLDFRADDRRWYHLLEQPLRVWGHGPHRPHPDRDAGVYATCLSMMLDHGAPAGAVGRHGFALLHGVAAGGKIWNTPVMTDDQRLAFARLLLDHGAPLNHRDELLRSTPLGWACRYGRLALVRLLLERGAPVHEPTTPEWAQPMRWAERMDHPAITAMLADHA